MGYIPTEWQTGDIITAAKLNKAEEGIAAASDFRFTASITYDDQDVGTLDKTFEEIETAFNAGKICVVKETDGSTQNLYLVQGLMSNADSDQYQVYIFLGSNDITLYAASKADYPSTTQPPESN